MVASSISPSLPPELWLDIISLAVHSPGFFNTKWDYSPDELIWQGAWLSEKGMESESLRMRTNIVRVSREWRDLGRQFIYEDLAVSNEAKVKALATLFEQSTSINGGDAAADTLQTGYGRWVKRFSINSRTLFERDDFPDLERLLRQCPNVRTILCNITIEDVSSYTRAHQLFRSVHSLRRLSFENLGVGEGSLDLFHQSPSPFSLDWATLPSSWMARMSPSIDDFSSPISLSNISVLEVDMHNNFPGIPAWDLPALRYLCIDTLYDAHISSMLSFIAINGRRLLGLSVRTSERCPSLQKLLEHTPSIRSLVFDDLDLDTLCEQDPPSYPSITHIGLAGTTYDSLADIERIRRGLDYILRCNLFPSLLTVRILDDRVPDLLINEWKDPIATAAQYRIRLEDYERRLLLRYEEEEPTE